MLGFFKPLPTWRICSARNLLLRDRRVRTPVFFYGFESCVCSRSMISFFWLESVTNINFLLFPFLSSLLISFTADLPLFLSLEGEFLLLAFFFLIFFSEMLSFDLSVLFSSAKVSKTTSVKPETYVLSYPEFAFPLLRGEKPNFEAPSLQICNLGSSFSFFSPLSMLIRTTLGKGWNSTGILVQTFCLTLRIDTNFSFFLTASYNRFCDMH